MTALFLPQAFKAVDGVVLFEGRPVPDFRAIALRHRLASKALDRSVSERSADIWWAFRSQLVKALNEAREQRREGFLLITNTTPHRAA